MFILAPKKFFVTLIFCHLVMLLFIIGSSHLTIINEEMNLSKKTYSVKINFLIPMDKDRFADSITLDSEFPKQKPKYTVTWLSNSIAEIKFWDIAYPLGQEIKIRVNGAKTKVPLISKNKTIKFRLPIKPEVINFNTIKFISTLEPLKILFNVPMTEKDIKQRIQIINLETGAKVRGTFNPGGEKIKGEYFQDDSCWFFKPEKKLKNNKKYKVIVESGIISKAGIKLEETYEKTITVASKPNFLEHNPTDRAKNISLKPKIELLASEILKTGQITVKKQTLHSYENVSGTTFVSKNKIVFLSEDVLQPNSTYIVDAIGYSIHNEPTNKKTFSFDTIKMDDKYWIDVKLGEIHTVTVYKGPIVVRHMVASGGKEETKTPLGTYYTGDKGYSFWSPRFGEGAIYWVRLVGQVLFHSVPRGTNGEIKEEEHYKLGLPASHGCIRLDDRDAKWIFNNIPYGTQVIIH